MPSIHSIFWSLFFIALQCNSAYKNLDLRISFEIQNSNKKLAHFLYITVLKNLRLVYIISWDNVSVQCIRTNYNICTCTVGLKLYTELYIGASHVKSTTMQRFQRRSRAFKEGKLDCYCVQLTIYICSNQLYYSILSMERTLSYFNYIN